MKSKTMLSLVMAAAITLGGAAMATNANFNATAASNGNGFTMGSVGLASSISGEGKAINMDSVFNATNMGVDKVATKSTQVFIKGNLPVTLSTLTIHNTKYTADGKNGPQDIISLTNVVAPTNVVSTWWEHYKMAITVTVNRTNNTSTTVYSRSGQFDSIFDTIQGTAHTGAEATIGLNELLGRLGTVNPGDVITITTQTQLMQTAGDSSGIPVTLSQDEINAFQGQKFGADFTIVATQQ